MKKLNTILIMLSLLGWHGISHAEQSSTERGRIDYINLKKSNIVVDDSSYQLAPNYVIKNSTGKVVSAFNLKKGQVVEVHRPGGKGLVSEIVIVK